MESRSSDKVYMTLAHKRITRWPREWRTMLVNLPDRETRVLSDLAVYLDARPADGETAA